jgi:polysaccharide biosynthesis transport protein
VELTGYLAVARRWWWTLLVATWVAGVSGYVVASQIPPTYEAETQLLVGPYNTDRDTLVASGDLVQTYSQLVTTTPLLESAIAEAGATLTATDLNLATRVTANDTTRFLTIRVQDTSPVMAATLANKLADELTLLASRGTNRPEGQVTVVDFAVPPTDAVAPQKSLIVGLAALAALIGAMVLVMLLEYLSAAVRSEDELGRLTGLPLLGRLDIARSLPGERGLIDQAPDSAAAAAYRLVLAKAAFRETGGPARSIVVIGTGSDGASSQVASNLAAITARSGRQVVLVDYDASDASVTRIFGLHDRSGVTDLVDASPADVSSRLVRVSSTLRILAHGISQEPDTIDPDRAAAVIAALVDQADLVLINAGVLHLSAGALAWAQAADAAILVAVRDQARRDDVEYAAESLRLVGVEVAGTVLAERKRGIRRGRGRAEVPERPRPTARETPREPVRDPFREPRREPVRESFREQAREPSREPVREPVREVFREPMRQPAFEPLRELRPEPVREPFREPVIREAFREPIVRTSPEPVRDIKPEPIREIEPEPIPEIEPEPIREIEPEPIREIEPEPIREIQPRPRKTPTRRSPRRRSDPSPNA